MRPLGEVASNTATAALLQTQRDNAEILANQMSSTLGNAAALYREDQSRKFTADQNRRERQGEILSRMAGAGLGIDLSQLSVQPRRINTGDPMEYARYLRGLAAEGNSAAYALLRGGQTAISNTQGIALPNS